jgi:hypothetical protein
MPGRSQCSQCNLHKPQETMQPTMHQMNARRHLLQLPRRSAEGGPRHCVTCRVTHVSLFRLDRLGGRMPDRELDPRSRVCSVQCTHVHNMHTCTGTDRQAHKHRQTRGETEGERRETFHCLIGQKLHTWGPVHRRLTSLSRETTKLPVPEPPHLSPPTSRPQQPHCSVN